MSRVLLGEVASERKESFKGAKSHYPVVGLEHLIPGEITLTKWEENSDNTFTKTFRKGDVLFGRRRAYLKKAAIAPFDGICSGDVTVITPDPKKILPELLPFIIQNDALFSFAVEKSAGSLSPRVKWEHLKSFEFELPRANVQRELAEILWSMESTRQSYQELITATDELVKSRFVEMFNGNYSTVKLGDVIQTTSGGTPSKSHPEYYDGGLIPWLTSSEVNAGVITSVKNRITKEGMNNSSAKMVPANSVVVAMYGATAGVTGILRVATTTNQAVCSLLPNDRFLPEYLYYAVGSKKSWMISQCQGGGQPNISQGIIKSMEIIDAPLESQKHFTKIAKQVDKSKLALQKCLEELSEFRKSLMKHYLG